MIQSYRFILYILAFIINDISCWPASTARGSSGARSSSFRSHHYRSSRHSSESPSASSAIALLTLLGFFTFVITYSVMGTRNLDRNIQAYKEKFRSKLMKHIPLQGHEEVLLIGPVTEAMIKDITQRLPFGNVSVFQRVFHSSEFEQYDTVVLLTALDIEEDSQPERERIFKECIKRCRDKGSLVFVERSIESDSRWSQPQIPANLKLQTTRAFPLLNTRYFYLNARKNRENIGSYPWRVIILGKKY